MAARCKAERSVLLSTEQVRSSCPPGRDEPQRSRHKVHLRPLSPSKRSRHCDLLYGPSRLQSCLKPFHLRLENCVLRRCCGKARPGGGWRGSLSPDSAGEGGRGPRIQMVLPKDALRGIPVGVSLDLRLAIYCNVLLKTKGPSLIPSSFSAPL